MKQLTFHPPVIAHRGASGYAPENTIAAFTKAAQLGVTWIEFDVRQSKDGQAMIIHDERLDKTTESPGKVQDYDCAYLQTLDAGRWFDPVFSSEKIPTLLEAINFIENTRINANVEIKPSSKGEIEDERFIQRILSDLNPYLHNQGPTILFSSFSVNVLKILRNYAPMCLIGLLLDTLDEDWLALSQSLQCVSIHVDQKIMTQEAAVNIKSTGKSLLCYTVNSGRRANQLFSWGVDAVFSDMPDRIIEERQEI